MTKMRIEKSESESKYSFVEIYYFTFRKEKKSIKERKNEKKKYKS